MQADVTEQQPETHPQKWWGQFPDISERFDVAYVVDEIGDMIVPRIVTPLLRREVEIATAVVSRHLARPANTDLAESARAATDRLTRTLQRMHDRAGASISTAEADIVLHALEGRYAAAAAGAEGVAGFLPVLKVFVTALRLERFDIPLTLKLLDAGRPVAEAVRSAGLVGRYGWWPTWLLQIVSERAMAGTLDEETIAALDNCAYASLSQLQARLARDLLNGDPKLLAEAARRLEILDEPDAAERLRHGDFNMVALAARLMAT